MTLPDDEVALLFFLPTTAATPSATATATATIISTKGWMKLRGCEWRLVLGALLL